VAIANELEGLLGRTVDFVSMKYLNPHLRDRVIAQSQVLYDRDSDPVAAHVARPA